MDTTRVDEVVGRMRLGVYESVRAARWYWPSLTETEWRMVEAMCEAEGLPVG